MTICRIATCVGLTALAGTLLVSSEQPVHALTMKECSAKYQAAKAAGTLGGQNWRDFRKAECGAAASAAAPTAAPATAQRPAGNAVFPTAISPKSIQREQDQQWQRRSAMDPEGRRLLQRVH